MASKIMPSCPVSCTLRSSTTVTLAAPWTDGEPNMFLPPNDDRVDMSYRGQEIKRKTLRPKLFCFPRKGRGEGKLKVDSGFLGARVFVGTSLIAGDPKGASAIEPQGVCNDVCPVGLDRDLDQGCWC